MPLMETRWAKVATAFLLDLVLGDPRRFPHPVTAIAQATDWLERRLRRSSGSPSRQKAAGALLVLLIVSASYWLPTLLLRLAGSWRAEAEAAVEVWLLYTTLAVKSLGDHVFVVYQALARGDLPAARQAVSRLVGRDTARLDQEEVCRAALESAAESAGDGIVAPLFYAFLGGAPGALAYKAVNTLDSLLGHKDERYLHFGWAAARLDDLANFLPARLTALLLAVGGSLRGYDGRGGLRAVARDARLHPSPNSGYPEAALAGLLGVQLGGLNYYRGVPSFRPFLGDPREPLRPSHLLSALRVVRAAAWLALLGGLAVWILPRGR